MNGLFDTRGQAPTHCGDSTLLPTIATSAFCMSVDKVIRRYAIVSKTGSEDATKRLSNCMLVSGPILPPSKIRSSWDIRDGRVNSSFRQNYFRDSKVFRTSLTSTPSLLLGRVERDIERTTVVYETTIQKNHLFQLIDILIGLHVPEMGLLCITAIMDGFIGLTNP